MRHLKSLPGYQFWEDSLSLTQYAPFGNLENIGSKQLTDIYLLGLAASREGKLVSLDKRTPQSKTSVIEDTLLVIES